MEISQTYVVLKRNCFFTKYGDVSRLKQTFTS